MIYSCLFSLMLCVFFFYFVFQAEDGIRDGSVTGVQTCALPILNADDAAASAARSIISIHEERAPVTRHRHQLSPARACVRKIGRASCRARGKEWVGDVSVEKNLINED